MNMVKLMWHTSLNVREEYLIWDMGDKIMGSSEARLSRINGASINRKNHDKSQRLFQCMAMYSCNE